jgi:hypothetical protein
VADELEPVKQSFEADLADYIEPISAAGDDTEEFAATVEGAKEALSGFRDDAAEAGAGLGDLAASEDDATVSTEALAESVGSLRDKVYEMYPGIDEATAALLAEASAAEAAGVANDEYAASAAAANREAGGLHDTLGQLRNLLGDAELGESLVVARTGMNQFAIDAENDADRVASRLSRVRTSAGLLDDAMEKTARTSADFWEAVNALNPALAGSEDIAAGARTALLGMGASEMEAAAGAAALAKAQRDVDEALNAAGGGGGLLSGLFQFFAGGGEGGASIAGLLGNVASLGAGMLVAAPAIGAVVVELGALVGGLVAAGAGIGAFAVLAFPTFSKLASSYKSIATAQAAYNAAVALEARDPTKSNLTAEATALAKLKDAYAAVPAYIRPALHDIEEIKAEYLSMAKAFAPDAFKVLDKGLGAAKEILPELEPLAKSTAGALSTILGDLDKALAPGKESAWERIGNKIGPGKITVPGGFQQFTEFLSKISPGVIEAVALGLGRLGSAFSKDMESFSKKDYINAVNIAFDILIGTLNRVTYFAHNVMNMWDDLSAAFKNTKNWLDDANTDFSNLRTFVSLMVADLVGIVIGDWNKLYRETRQWWTTIGHAVENGTDAARETVIRVGHDIESDWDHSWSAVVNFARGVPGKIKGALGNLDGLLIHAGESVMGGFLHGIESGFDDVKNFVSGIGGWIASHKGPVEADAVLLRPHGYAIMQGLVQGMRDGMPELRAFLGLTSSAITGLGGGPGGAGLGGRANVTVPLSLVFGAGTGGLANDPRLLQMVQQAVQEATLRYGKLNQSSGLILPGH